MRLKADHLNQAPAQHSRQGKALWSTWQVDYVEPLKPSHGKKFILVGVEVVSGLSVATAVGAVTRDQMVCECTNKFCNIFPSLSPKGFTVVFKVGSDMMRHDKTNTIDPGKQNTHSHWQALQLNQGTNPCQYQSPLYARRNLGTESQLV
ncbi:hypothetical protein QYF61_011372 [Mycteria americana]|uniref:Uncharacterized protein n=1 Tax=Mycteria americana TaxID=33587 RepID=A0AAN7NP09_MYCAM|nr:hypothetical protein QYF61_011372 [Mycteria americana]